MAILSLTLTRKLLAVARRAYANGTMLTADGQSFDPAIIISDYLTATRPLLDKLRRDGKTAEVRRYYAVREEFGR